MPPSRVNRPSALDLSFGISPTETPSTPASGSSTNTRLTQSNSANDRRTLKRKGTEPQQSVTKKAKLPDTGFYCSPANTSVTEESLDLILEGEDPDEEDEREGSEKPVRYLSNFAVFDTRHRNEFVLLSIFGEDDHIDREIEAAGYANARFRNQVEEDEGQEDYGSETNPGLYLRLKNVIGFYMDYTSPNGPPYLETKAAWYILQTPSEQYRPFLRYFLIPRRLVQISISWALKHRVSTYKDFMDYLDVRADPFGSPFEEEDVTSGASKQVLREVIQEMYDDDRNQADEIRTTTLIRHWIPVFEVSTRRRKRKTGKPPQLSRNPDTAVLLADNQTSTHATPRIFNLAHEFFTEKIRCIGPVIRKAAGEEDLENRQERAATDRLRKLIKKASQSSKFTLDYRREHATRGRKYLRAVQIDGTEYRVGDTVIVPIGVDEEAPKSKKAVSPPVLPPSDDGEIDGKHISDYFWFAKIIYINWDMQKVHVQWFNHSSKTILQEIHDPHELFLQHLCHDIPMKSVIAPVGVHRVDCTPDPTNPIPFGEFYYKMMYDPSFAVFSNLETPPLANDNIIPKHCHICDFENGEEERKAANVIREGDKRIGMSYNGVILHPYDFVLYKNPEKGPACIGQIREIQSGSRDIQLVVRRLGRVAQLAENVLPEEECKDERHLFLTKSTDIVDHTSIIRSIYVCSAINLGEAAREEWLAFAPEHYFLRYAFPSMDVTDWGKRRRVSPEKLDICMRCMTERVEYIQSMKEFITQKSQQPLRAMDIFGGAAAMGAGMEMGSRCIKVTHAIELSPSTARTYSKNSPHTKVFNQCVNIVLRYIVRRRDKHTHDKDGNLIEKEVPLQLYDRDGKTQVPEPPRKGQIDVIIAGLPCQTHSGLNMYKKANDRKSSLVVPLLSFVDFYRPTYVFIENVPGFLYFNLLAKQKDQHTLEGGIKQGGVKLLIRALVDMGYQVRFAHLQAGHYGTPQHRIRFLLIAAKMGSPLPDLPQPTHDFDMKGTLPVHFDYEKDDGNDEPQLENDKSKNKRKKVSRRMNPINTARGVALHPAVSVRDAIGDLHMFDWKHPNPKELTPEMRQYLVLRQTQGKIPAVTCKRSDSRCVLGVHGYRYAKPKTRFQINVRVRPAVDLQHFTRVFGVRKMMRVIETPPEANADGRELRPSLGEYQLVNPSSWVARSGYRRSLYKRLDENSYFQTTITNIDPTAKQSKVLHPTCLRILTVRELARSQGIPDYFVFEALEDNIVTMHRMIGNAVPFPVSIAIGRQLQLVEYQRWKDRIEAAVEPEVIEVD